MTPKSKTEKSTTIAIERRRVDTSNAGNNNSVHIAGGDHKGIVINKEAKNGTEPKRLLTSIFVAWPSWFMTL